MLQRTSAVGRSRAAQLGGVALTVGLVVSGVATATPAGASDPSKTMKIELHKLRICESGDNYRENSGNGYYGAYQFSPTTWKALGFRGRPDEAKAVTQDHAARKLHRIAGWSAWPSCSHTEHLR